ncbi:MAG TPA: uroporphyrinogen-III C-methyltransferase [Candidatus Binatia bacterium]|nr:uroporphyrinogen-III C-methyltransferase [Candidatus Binatia bacterium]
MASGTVYLVGAGPGDPGCLTLRGRDCLGRADVVVYDYLANPELLRHAPARAERVFAGKHGRGPRLLEQDEINRLLVERARAGQTVVRLKGGDPMVFGRGGEEAEALVAAGVPFEVVPGVTAALAVPAFAGIPVTHRDWVSGVTVVTGHEAEHESRVRWDRIATAGNTIVLMMGVTQIRPNLEGLLAAGLPPDTPGAAVRWGGTPRQQVVTAAASDLARSVESAGLRPPVTIVLGPTVRLHDRLDWFARRPLFGRRIVVTRARAQASRFAALLAERGAEVVECPAIEIAPPDSYDALDRAIDRLDGYDWVLFTSVNGVDRFFDRLDERGVDVRALHRARIAAIGPETARSLSRLHLRSAVVPDDFRAEGLIAALSAESLAGARVLLPRAAGAREILPRELERLGAEVEEVVTYRSVRPPESAAILHDALAAGPVDAVAFTSSSTVRGFLALLAEVDPSHQRLDLARVAVACIGPVTADTAREAGLSVAIVAESYTVPALATAIERHFADAADAARNPASAGSGDVA